MIEHTSHYMTDCCVLYQTREKITTRLNLPLHMILDGRRDPPAGDITPLAGMPSSLVEEARGSSEWSSIPMLSGSVILKKIDKKNQKNMSSQRTPREAQKVWRLLIF